MEKLDVFELMPELFSRSEIMILDFNQIGSDLPEYKNIKLFFERSRERGIDPRLPEQRQKFNDSFLQKTGNRYLVSRYGEDRLEMLKGSKIARERRTIHLGVDIFSSNLETIYAPCDAQIVLAGREEGGHSFGYYIVLQPSPAISANYIFLAHLARDLPQLGKVTRGQAIAKLGDYVNGENGGWSRHLHVQLLASLPVGNALPPGYSSREKFEENALEYPDPSFLVFK